MKGCVLMQAVHKLITMALAGIQEEKVLALVRTGLSKGIDPFSLLEEVRLGMDIVIERYSSGEYFLADLVVAADIFSEAQKMVLGPCAADLNKGVPQVIFGTVKKDIHDIGKNIAIATMRQYGLNVLDLGVDVTPEMFVAKLKETGALILCLSGLISDSYDSMKDTVTLVRHLCAPASPTIIIGGLVNDAVCSYSGADYWVKDCTCGADLCKQLINKGTNIRTINGQMTRCGEL